MQDAECGMQKLTHSQERADRVPMQDACAECKNSPNIGRRGQKKESYRMHNAGAEYIIPPKSALCVQRGSVWCRCSLYRLCAACYMSSIIMINVALSRMFFCAMEHTWSRRVCD